MAYGWPGNVRELQNVIERAVALADGPVIEVQDVPLDLMLPDVHQLVAIRPACPSAMPGSGSTASSSCACSNGWAGTSRRPPGSWGSTGTR